MLRYMSEIKECVDQISFFWNKLNDLLFLAFDSSGVVDSLDAFDVPKDTSFLRLIKGGKD